MPPRVRKRSRCLMPPLPQSPIARPVTPKVLSPPSWQMGMERDTNPPSARREQVTPGCAAWAPTGPWGWVGSSRVLQELLEELATPPSIVGHQPWLTREVPEGGTNVTPSSKKGG